MAKTPTPTKTQALRVVSKSPLGTLRRAGFVFGAEPVTLPLAELSAEQEQAIRAEPLLVVTEIELEAAAPQA